MQALFAPEWGDHSRSKRLKPTNTAMIIIIIASPTRSARTGWRV